MIAASDLLRDFGLRIPNDNTPATATTTGGTASFAEALSNLLQPSGGAPGAPAVTSDTQAANGYDLLSFVNTAGLGDGGITVGINEIAGENLSGVAPGTESVPTVSESCTVSCGATQDSVQEMVASGGPNDDLVETASTLLHFDSVAQMECELPQVMCSMQQQLGDAEAQAQGTGSVTNMWGMLSFGITAGGDQLPADDADPPPLLAAGMTWLRAGPESSSSSSNAPAGTCTPATTPQPASPSDAASSSACAAGTPAPGDEVTAADLLKGAAASDAEFMQAELRMKDSQTLQAEIQALFGGGPTA